LQVNDLGDGKVEIIESVAEINKRYTDKGLLAPIVIIDFYGNSEKDYYLKTIKTTEEIKLKNI